MTANFAPLQLVRTTFANLQVLRTTFANLQLIRATLQLVSMSFVNHDLI